MAEVTIQTAFGKIGFSYNTPEELTAALKSIEEQIGAIQEAAKRIAPPSPRIPKAGCEEIYRFLPSGQVELFRFPKVGTKAAALALFAYHPQMVTPEEIELVTGIESIKDKVFKQSLNKKYFRKVNDCYGLSPEGFKLVFEDILPSLSVSGEISAESQPAEEQAK